MKDNKMQWLIDAHKAGKAVYEIAETGKLYGTVCKPTGVGKSAIIFNDIIYNINRAKESSIKLIINLSTPIIRLCEQQGADFLQLLGGVAEYYNIDPEKVVLFINNSGNDKAYIKSMTDIVIDKYPLSDFKHTFVESDLYDVAIVISCHKSLDKFTKAIGKLDLLGTQVITYIDEAHTITITSEEDDDAVNLNKLCKLSRVYMISATPKEELVRLVNEYNGLANDNSFIVHMTPADAIKKNLICSPDAEYCSNDEATITPEICLAFMQQCKRHNPNIYHKVLITCGDTAQLVQLRDKLAGKQYKVFSTSSATGMNDDTKYQRGETNFDNVKDFIAAIDGMQDDCFVLHIRQMISGIDIATLSDAIIPVVNTELNKYQNVVQTIGRTLRLGSERGKKFEDRKKKESLIMFVCQNNNKEIEDRLSEFLLRYYGIDNIKFACGNNKQYVAGNDEGDIELSNAFNSMRVDEASDYKRLLIDVEKLLLEKYIPYFDTVSHGIVTDKAKTKVVNEIVKLKQKYPDMNNMYLLQFINNNDLKKDVEKLFNKILVTR